MKKIASVGDWDEFSVDDNPIHNVYVNRKTGEKSYKDHAPIEITDFHNCQKHYFEPINGNGDLQCVHCHYPRRIVWGIHICKDGDIIKL